MIVIGSKGDNECTLHTIFGPETELSMDVLGVNSVDISQLISECEKNVKVMLKLTRSRNEYATALALKAAKVPYLASFNPIGTAPASKKQESPRAGVNDDVGLPDLEALGTEPDDRSQPGAIKSDGKCIGKCSYCGASAVLLDIPGFEICSSCATIELGRRRADKIKAVG